MTTGDLRKLLEGRDGEIVVLLGTGDGTPPQPRCYYALSHESGVLRPGKSEGDPVFALHIGGELSGYQPSKEG